MTTRLDEAVRKSLEAAQGSKVLAQRLLVEQVLEDDQLLRALVAPFLKPIALKWIEQAQGGRVSAPSPLLTTPRGAGGERPGAPREGGEDVRSPYNPMRAALSATDAPRRPPASSRHVSTLKLLAAAYAMKRGEKVGG